MKEKVILIIRDGWGYRKETKLNAIAKAKLPNTDYLMKNFPNVLLDASGEAVGLPKGYMGNSEVGHLTIGSGRVIFQSLERINHSIKDKSFFKNKDLISAINNCKKNKTKLHIIGLLQTEGVHSHINHLFAILDLCKKEKFYDVLIHAITDGRDAPTKDSLKHIKSLNFKLKSLGFGKIVTVSGRYYAMDRDNRWDRTKLAYDAIVNSKGNSFDNITSLVTNYHKNNITDEFIVPSVSKDYSGVNNFDSIIFFNFRTDRPRQLTKAIVEKNFKEFKTKKLNVTFCAMTQYYSKMNAKVIFPDLKHKNLLGDVISKNHLKQLRISETEKYAHVTFFFNGQNEKPNKNEDRILIPSPKVATYDLKPEMSVDKIANVLCKEISKQKYDFIVTNLVNADMVGHTGKFDKIILGIEALDDALGKIVFSSLENSYTILICADHGNCEDKTKLWQTSHTKNKVPFILVSNNPKVKNFKLKNNCSLKDIAPTILNLIGLKKPKDMTGFSIIK